MSDIKINKEIYLSEEGMKNAITKVELRLMNHPNRNFWSDYLKKYDKKTLEEWHKKLVKDTDSVSAKLEEWKTKRYTGMTVKQKQGQVMSAVAEFNDIIRTANALKEVTDYDQNNFELESNALVTIDMLYFTAEIFKNTVNHATLLLMNRVNRNFLRQYIAEGRDPKDLEKWYGEMKSDTEKLQKKLDEWMGKSQFLKNMKDGEEFRLEQMKDWQEKEVNDLNAIIVELNLLPEVVTDYGVDQEKMKTVLVHKEFVAGVEGYADAIKQIVHGGSNGRSGPGTDTRHLHVGGVATDNLIFRLGEESELKALGNVNFHMEKNTNKQQKAQAKAIQDRETDEDNFVRYIVGNKKTFKIAPSDTAVQLSLNLDAAETGLSSSLFAQAKEAFDRAEKENMALISALKRKVVSLEKENALLRARAAANENGNTPSKQINNLQRSSTRRVQAPPRRRNYQRVEAAPRVKNEDIIWT